MISKLLRKNRNRNQKGFTIIELMISIVVGSVVIMILTQQLSQVILFRRLFDLENRMANQAYIIAETIKFNVFELETQEIVLVDDGNPDTVVLEARYLYDITSGPGNIIIRDYLASPITNTIILNTTTNSITYDGQELNASSIDLLEGSSITIERLDPDSCSLDPGQDICGEGIINIVLVMRINGGDQIQDQTYSFTIIV
jgi:prepilin-type N-terminal cleavage/methylation domain-containing protein